MKKVLVMAVAVVALAVTAMANDYSVQALESNAVVTAGAGVQKVTGTTTMFETVGLNVGLPVTKVNGIVIGAQVGGDVNLEETKNNRHAFDGDVTAGVFARNIVIQGYDIAGAALFNYNNTADHANLVSFTPIAGVKLTAKDEVGVAGNVGIVSYRGESVNEDAIGFWTRDWNDQISTQARIGYQLNHTDCIKGGASAEYRLTKLISVIASGDVTANHDYTASVGFSIGGKGQSGSNLSQIGGTGLTPFSR